MKDKFGKIIYAVFILILVLIFIGIKSYNLYKFNIDNISIKKNENISLKATNKKSNIKIENMNFYLDKTYISDESGLEFYKIEKSSNEIQELPTNEKEEVNKTKTINVSVYHNVLRGICNESELNPIEYLDLETDEIKLINNYIDTQNEKNNVLSSTKNIKMKYLQVLLLKTIKVSNEISFIEGLNGIFSDNKVIIFNNHDAYIIDFDESYNELEIKNILNTINFDE